MKSEGQRRHEAKLPCAFRRPAKRQTRAACAYLYYAILHQNRNGKGCVRATASIERSTGLAGNARRSQLEEVVPHDGQGDGLVEVLTMAVGRL